MPIEEAFATFARWAALIVQAVAVVIVLCGSLEAAVGIARTLFDQTITLRSVWRRFARWIVLGLEFALAADIVLTAIAPTWNDIGQLAAIAAIRTFLNYFLTLDIERTPS